MGCRPSFAGVAALNTVRSAPVSTRNGTFTQASLPALIFPATMGLMAPSSSSAHSPSIRIDTCDLLPWDIVNEAAIILRMCGYSLGNDCFGCVRDEQFFTSNTDAFPAV